LASRPPANRLPQAYGARQYTDGLPGVGTRMDERIQERLRIGFLLAVVILIYSNSLWNQFTMDDELYILQNPQVTHVSWRGLLAPNAVTNVFRPLTFATLALNWTLHGAQPFGFHLLNLLLHASVTLLLYFLLGALLEGIPHRRTVAFVAAALFAVHPIHTEAVTSIVGRPELLAAGFLLAAWILHLRDREIPALACFVLALLSKESAAAFLPLVVAGDYARGKWKPPLRYARMAGLTTIYLGLLWKVQGGRFGQRGISLLDNPLAQLPAGWRILNAVRIAWKYVALQIYPATLSCDYSFNQIQLYKDWLHTLPATVAAAAVVGAWLWAVRKRKSEWVLAGAIYLGAFATTANILIPTGTILGERLAYLPSAGLCLLLAAVWTRLYAQPLQRREQTLALAVVVIMVGALGVRTVIRNRDWRSNLTLFTAAVHAAPGSAKARMNLASAYRNEKRLDLARDEFEAVLRIYPNYPDALAGYGLVDFQLGDYKDAERMMEQALDTTNRNNPNYDFIAVNLAALWMQTGDNFDAIDLLNRVTTESPGYARAWSNRAVIRYRLGQPGKARTDAETALRLDPNNSQARELMQLLNGSSTSASASRQ
jgi:protein O-mannosyl-transferase